MDNRCHRDFSHEDEEFMLRVEDSMQVDSTHALGHSDEWYPWRSRAVSSACVHIHVYGYQITSPQAFTLDAIANIPRSGFSRQQMEIIFWFLKANGVSRIPSVRTLRSQNAVLHSMCGIRTLEYKGAFGHLYFINSLADIIRQVQSSLLFGMHYLICLHRKWPIRAFAPTFIFTLKTLARPLTNIGMQDTGTRQRTHLLLPLWQWSTTLTFSYTSRSSLLMAALSCRTVGSYVTGPGPSLPVPGHFALSATTTRRAGSLKSSIWSSCPKENCPSHLGLGEPPDYTGTCPA